MLNRRNFLSASAMALAFTASAAHADDWKAKYKELTFAVVPAENASGVNDRYAPFIDLSLEGTRRSRQAAHRQ